MANPSIKLRGGQSGPTFFPSTPGHVLTIDADGETVTPKPGAGGGGLVSFAGRTTPAAVPTAGDYDASEVTNNSTVAGLTVEEALETLQGEIDDLPASGLVSFAGRTTPAAVPTAGDYTSTQVTNASGVDGSTVSASLDVLAAAIAARLVSFNGRTAPAVIPTLNDYQASLIANNSATFGSTVKDGLNGLWQGLGDGSFIFNVGKGPNCYSSITAAITAINILIGGGVIGPSQRATIFVMPGQYVSTAPYQVPGRIGVRGISCSTVQLINATTNMFTAMGDNVWFENFLVEGSANPAIYVFDMNNRTGTHVRFVNQLNNGGASTQKFLIQSGATWKTMFIEHCVIDSFQPSDYSIRLFNTSGVARFLDVEVNDVFLDNYHLTTFGGGFLLRQAQDVRFRDCVIRGTATNNTSIRHELAGATGTPEIQIMTSLLFSGLPGAFAGVPLFAEAGTKVNLYHSEAPGTSVLGTLVNHFSTVV